ncbi:MAG: restriction endonuclease [Methanocella sp.]|jgi:restriction endonuclease Mrr
MTDRQFEESVETFYKNMGYNTRKNTVLHTRSVHIHAHLDHPKEKYKVIVECKPRQEPVDIQEVQRFCSKIAFARENKTASAGVLISNTGFTKEAIDWVSKNCTFVRLRTYKQLIQKSTKVNKIAKKLHFNSP